MRILPEIMQNWQESKFFAVANIGYRENQLQVLSLLDRAQGA
jgi:hypothetical protein